MVNLAEMLIKVGALKFGDFVLSSGKRSNVYVDIKLASTYPEILETISEEISKRLNFDFDKIACVELGGVPTAVAVSLKVRKPLVIFRKQKKDYGVGEDRIGFVGKGEKFVLIEDVITTGRSARSVIERIEKSGGKVLKVFAVVDREESDLEVESLLKLSDLLKEKDFVDTT